MLTLILLMTAGNAAAQIGEEGNFSFMGNSNRSLYQYPEIEPEVSVAAGYRLTDVEGSRRAAEYEYLKDTWILSGSAVLFPFPHRIFLETDIRNTRDYFADARYAYKDLVLLRWINRTLFHNLENVRLIDLDPSTASPGVKSDDGEETYGRETGINTLFLRLKTPNYPLHVYAEGWQSEKEGKVQQRSLQGSAFFTNVVRATQRRDVDFITLRYTIGANAHLGPVEADASHSEHWFDVEGDGVLHDTYAASTFRAAGTYPHNQVSEFKEFRDTFKLHTSYTGRLVASASVSMRERENRDSGAKSDYLSGAGAVTWMPLTKLTFFLRYSRLETELDNPASVAITDILDSANTRSFSVKPSISSSTDYLSLTGRYRPASRVTVRAKYSLNAISRENSAQWGLPEDTKTHTASVTANMRVMKGVGLDAKYTAKGIDNPAYRTDPAFADEGVVTLSLAPASRVSALLCYGLGLEKRDSINREVRRNKAFGSGTVLIMKGLSFTASYAYLYNKTEFDLEYDSKVDSEVPYTDKAQVYSADIGYMPGKNLNLNFGVAHTMSEAKFTPASGDLLQPVSVASFSELEAKDTVYSASGDYRCKRGYGLGVDYKYRKFDDFIDNPNDDLDDGNAQIIMMTVSRKW